MNVITNREIKYSNTYGYNAIDGDYSNLDANSTIDEIKRFRLGFIVIKKLSYLVANLIQIQVAIIKNMVMSTKLLITRILTKKMQKQILTQCQYILKEESMVEVY